MSRMKMKTGLIIILAMLLLFPLNVFADTTSKVLVHSVEFSEIGPLLEVTNLTIEETEESYEDAEKARDRGIPRLNQAITDLNLLIGAFNPPEEGTEGSDDSGESGDESGTTTTDPLVETAIQLLLEAQMQSLLEQRASLRDIDLDKLEVQKEMTLANLTWNMENVFLTYNALSNQIEDLLGKKDLTAKQIKVMESQEELGLVKELDIEKTKHELTALENTIQQLKNTQEQLKQQFNIVLSQDHDTELEIGEVPVVLASHIESLDVDEDYEEAWEDSFDVQLNEDEDAKKEREAIWKFKQGFYSAYDSLLEKKAELEVEKAKLQTQNKSYNIAKIKNQLGLISDLEMQTEENAYNSQKIAVSNAEQAQFKAFRAYEWARNGLLVNSDSSAAMAASM